MIIKSSWQGGDNFDPEEQVNRMINNHFEELKAQIESIYCPIHHRTALVRMEDEGMVVESCCSELREKISRLRGDTN